MCLVMNVKWQIFGKTKENCLQVASCFLIALLLHKPLFIDDGCMDGYVIYSFIPIPWKTSGKQCLSLQEIGKHLWCGLTAVKVLSLGWTMLLFGLSWIRWNPDISSLMRETRCLRGQEVGRLVSGVRTGTDANSCANCWKGMFTGSVGNNWWTTITGLNCSHKHMQSHMHSGQHILEGVLKF